MPKKDKVIENLERCLKNNASPDRYIKKLRDIGEVNILLNTRREEITVLMYYVREGHLQKVKELLAGQNRANPIITNKESVNALSIAVRKACEDANYDKSIIDELLKINPEQQLLQKDDNNSIPLHAALEKGDVKLIQVLLQYAPEEQLTIKTKTEEDTAFVFAVRSRNNELIAGLINQYPTILEGLAKDGFTPLHIACRFSNVAITRLLLEKGNKKQTIIADSNGMIPLVDACINKQPEIIKELLKYNLLEQLTYEDMFGHTIFHTLCVYGLLNELALIIRCAQENKLNLEAALCKKGKQRLIPLHLLISSSLLKSPEKINAIDGFINLGGIKQLELQDSLIRQTCLLRAIEANDFDLVKKLLSYNSHSQYLLTDLKKQNPLMLAIKNKLMPVIQLLLELGPPQQLYQLNFLGMSPLCYAVLLKSDVSIITILLEYIEKNPLPHEHEAYSPLHFALSYKDTRLFELLIESRYCQHQVNYKEKQKGNIPLHVAIEHNLEKPAQLLIQYGSEINLPNDLGWTSLHVACWTGNIELLRLLIAKGGNPHSKTKAGLSSLDIATAHGNLSIVKELLKHQVNVNTKDSLGKTALVMAVFHRHSEVMELLLLNGADPNVVIQTNDKYISPLFLALQQMDLPLIKALTKSGANVHQKLLKNNENSTILEYIKAKYPSHPMIYEKLPEIFTELPPISQVQPKTIKKETNPALSVEFPTFDVEDEILNPRTYLLSIGYSKEDVDAFEEERKNNKKRLKQNRYTEWPLSEKKVDKLVTWFDGKIKSTDDFILEIDSPGSERVYCYLDVANLVKQGCDESKIKNKRLKFDGYHIKKLDKDKNIFRELIKFSSNHSIEEMEYTHELKINKVDRILLIKKEGLYIGARYIPGGFHTGASVSSLQESIKNNNECLEINWPIDISQKTERITKEKANSFC